jgi:hypothetical protein
MPFESKDQQGYMHAHPEILGEEGLHEWDEATKGKYKSLPEHVNHGGHNPSYAVAYATRKKD